MLHGQFPMARLCTPTDIIYVLVEGFEAERDHMRDTDMSANAKPAWFVYSFFGD